MKNNVPIGFFLAYASYKYFKLRELECKLEEAEIKKRLQEMKEDRDKSDAQMLWQYSLLNNEAFKKAIDNPMTEEEMQQKLQKMKEERQREDHPLLKKYKYL